MALTWDDVTGKVNKHIIPRLVDNVYKSSPVFTRLRTRNAERFEGGTSFRHPIAFAELNGGAFQRGGTFNIAYVQTDTAHRNSIESITYKKIIDSIDRVVYNMFGNSGNSFCMV
jgi:hypothetical protein